MQTNDGFRRILESSPDLVSVVDRAGKFRYANATHRLLLGREPEALIGTMALDLVHPEDRPIAALGLRDAFCGEPNSPRDEARGVPLRLQRADGRWVLVQTDASFVQGCAADPELVLVTRAITGTDRKSPSELERLTAILRAQGDAYPDGVLVVAPRGETVSYNQRFLDLWGLTAEETELGYEARAARVVQLLKDPRAILGLIDQIYAAPADTFDLVVELKNDRWLEMHTAPLFGSAEEIYGRAWFYRDVSERIAAERELKLSEERYRRLVELSPNGIGVHQAGTLRYINEAGVRMFNTSREDLIGTNVFASVHPEDRPAVIAAALEQDFEAPRFVEARLTRPDGQQLTVELASSGTFFDGKPATQTVLRDITDRRAAERAMEESEARYRSLVESAPDAIYVHDEERIVYANQAAATLLGFERPLDMVGRRPHEVLGGIAREEVERRVARAIEGETLRFAERRSITFAAREVDLEITSAPATFQGRRVSQVILRDVSDRRRAEEERLALERKMLETQKLESLGVLAGGIAHDFNNLLVAIMGNAGLGLLDAEPGSAVAACLRDIETASQRAADLARQMLAYSGRGRFVVEAIEMSGLVREMANLLSASLPGEAELVYALSENLPTVEADATQVRQVVMNLVINAAEALAHAPGRILLETSLVPLAANELEAGHGAVESPGAFVSFKVTDTGGGMDAATRTKIFDPFYSTKFTGRGLGLAAVLGIVRGHRGLIRVDSAVGQGTTFEVLLPVSAGVRADQGS